MILAALHALILWLAVLLSTNADAHPVPDTPPAVAVGDKSPTTRHYAPPAPTECGPGLLALYDGDRLVCAPPADPGPVGVPPGHVAVGADEQPRNYDQGD